MPIVVPAGALSQYWWVGHCLVTFLHRPRGGLFTLLVDRLVYSKVLASPAGDQVLLLVGWSVYSQNFASPAGVPVTLLVG